MGNIFQGNRANRGGPGDPAERLEAALVRLQQQVTLQGWRLASEPAPSADNQVIVRLGLHRDGVLVSTCGFAVEPGAEVVFRRPAHRAVRNAIDSMGEADYHRLIAAWVDEVQAGIGHHWNYEAMRRGKPLAPPDFEPLGAIGPR
jgi:hypothetical protein